MKALLRLSIITGFLLAGFFTANSLAQSDGTGGSGIQISPTRTELSVLPGEQKTFKITLKNLAGIPMQANVFVNDFKSDGETGNPQIIVDPKVTTDRSIKPFLKNLQDYELGPNETKEVEITANVPVDTAPGGYFGVIRYLAIPKGRDLSEQDRQVALTASVGSLVLMQVSGDVTEGMTYDKLEVLGDGKAGSFFIKSPTQTLSRLTNTGNSFVQPFGRVSVNKNGKEVYSYEFNKTGPNRGTILPKSSRNFTDDLKNISGLGKYEIVSSLSFKQGGEVVTAKKTFYVIPLWFIITVAVIIVLLVIGLLRVRSKGSSRSFFKRKK